MSEQTVALRACVKPSWLGQPWSGCMPVGHSWRKPCGHWNGVGLLTGGSVYWVDHGGRLRCDRDGLWGLGGLGNISKRGGWPWVLTTLPMFMISLSILMHRLQTDFKQPRKVDFQRWVQTDSVGPGVHWVLSLTWGWHKVPCPSPPPPPALLEGLWFSTPSWGTNGGSERSW